MIAQTIDISRYQMRSDNALNSRSQSTIRDGALLRVHGNDGYFGYACLHPWVELGDLSLDTLLAQLKHGRYSRQVKSALHCAHIDLQARKNGLNLFAGIEVPDSHATIVGGIEQVEKAAAAGFDTIKLKMGRQIDENLTLANTIHRAFPELKIRIDLNGVLEKGGLESLLRGLESMHSQIDFIEDPCPFNMMDDAYLDTLKNRHGIRIGIDRGIGQYRGMECDYAVLKPAVNRAEPICDAAQTAGRKVVITSYMDHPLGQAYAAYIAATLTEKFRGVISKRCGLMTHHLYQASAYSECLNSDSPIWKKPEGSGLGFDHLLEDTNWLAI